MRVVRFHRLFFKVPPLVVLQVAERTQEKSFAEVSSAAKALMEQYRLRVIVDASHNSFDEAAVATMHEQVFQVEHMPRKLIDSLSGLGALHTALAHAELSDVVWELIGGNPAGYIKLNRACVQAGMDSISVTVSSFITDLLTTAIKNRSEAVVGNEKLQQLYAKFATEESVPSIALEDIKLVRPSPDKVLREVLQGQERVLVPATPAMRFVLRHGLQRAPALDALKGMLQPSGGHGKGC